jgi:hypothetical protein
MINQWDKIIKPSTKESTTAAKIGQNASSLSQKGGGSLGLKEQKYLENDSFSIKSMRNDFVDHFDIQKREGFSDNQMRNKRKYQNKYQPGKSWKNKKQSRHILQKAKKYSKNNMRFQNFNHDIQQTTIGVQTNKVSQTISTQTLGNEKMSTFFQQQDVEVKAQTLFDIKVHHDILQVIQKFQMKNMKKQQDRQLALQRLVTVIQNIF